MTISENTGPQKFQILEVPRPYSTRLIVAGTVVVYLNPPQGFQRKEIQENIETVFYTGTGDYVLKSPGGSRRVYRAKNVRKVRMNGNVEFVDQT